MFLSWVRTLTTGQHISWQSAKKYCCSKSIWRKVGKATAPRQNKGMISRVRLLIHARITAKIVSSQDARVRYVAMALEKKTGSEKDSFFVFHCPYFEFYNYTEIEEIHPCDSFAEKTKEVCLRYDHLSNVSSQKFGGNHSNTIWSPRILWTTVVFHVHGWQLKSSSRQCLLGGTTRIWDAMYLPRLTNAWGLSTIDLLKEKLETITLLVVTLELLFLSIETKNTHTQSKASDPCFWGLVFFHPFFSCPQVDGPQATPTHLSRQEICITWHMSCGFDMFCSEN